MQQSDFSESVVEQAALAWFAGLGYRVAAGPTLAGSGPDAERASPGEVVLARRLRDALARLNPTAPPDALDEAYRKVARLASPSLIENNQQFHRLLVDGVEVEYRRDDGRIVGDRVRLLDYDDADNNDWLVVNQLTVVDVGPPRRPDVVVFVNGLPLAVFELKDAADEKATIWTAYNQLQTYRQQLPSLMAYNEILAISDGVEARVGSLTSERERFLPWRAMDEEELGAPSLSQLHVLIEGLFTPRRLLLYLRHFVVFEDDGREVQKKLAAYHQFHAVNCAVEETVRASRLEGDRRVGVVWHTQGSGKSLTMVFYAGRLVLHPAMENPTIVMLTDRIDLDDQLFGTFSRCQELLRQTPAQAADRADLRELLRVAAGGVVFTTIQKFLVPQRGGPPLSERHNIVVIADEAHRSQYDFVDGFAYHMHEALPNASFIGFTGTPIELTDANTRAVFGDYISVYDILRAVEDGATVRIYYEGRWVQLGIDEVQRALLDPAFEEVTEGEEVERREKLKSKWAALEAVVGAEPRIRSLAADLVEHFEEREQAIEGKALIVCMSRRICVALYDELVRLRPHWHDDDDAGGAIKVVMTGSAADPEEWQPHVRSKGRRDAIAQRFKDPDDSLKLVIVRDMWLTGFDVPPLHTMYADKPMRGHGLMQAISRVNRVFRDKPGGLIVDFLGLGDQLRLALADYTRAHGRGQPTYDQAEAIAAMQAKYEIVAAMFHGFDYSRFTTGAPTERVTLIPAAMEHILSRDRDEGKARLVQAVWDLTKAFALSVPSDEAFRLRDDLAFFQAVRAAFVKATPASGRTDETLNHAVRQLVAKALTPNGVLDIFTAAGLRKPDISVLSDEFLAEVRELPQKNLAAEMLEKLLQDEIRTHARRRLVEGKSFADMLDQTLRRYRNRAIETAQLIEELIAMAKDLRAAQRRGGELGLTEEELAFYDALETNDSAVKVLGDDTLREIARELVETVRNNTTIDWMYMDGARAKLRVMVKRILRKHKYPPDKQERAAQTVLEQAELFSEEWATALKA